VGQSNAGPRAGYFPNVALRTHADKSVQFYDDLDRWAGCPALTAPEQIVRSILSMEGPKGKSVPI
jgi:hypothetical protein